jgi:carboxypeptidase Taq
MKEYFTYKTRSPILVELLELMGKVKDIEGAASVLSWDQETFMPAGAGEPRSFQLSALEVVSHSFLTSDKAKELALRIKDAGESSDPFENSMFRLFLREHERAVKLPPYFIQDYTLAKTMAIEAWKEARSRQKFSYFVNSLSKILEFKIQEAEYIGYEENRYDALLDYYEPGITVAKLMPMFDNLSKHALETLQKIEPYTEKINDDFIKQKFAASGQMKFIRNVAKKMAFDFYYGRIDYSIHPFTTSFSPKDVRVTTRINENEIRAGIYAAIHELGHALYEQGKDFTLSRTFADDGSSFGMHESQSLIWENIIARTREFWMWGLPVLQEIFPGQLANKFPSDIYQAVNVIRPSFIRTEADELTYNLHIVMRFNIENLLLNGNLSVRDIPGYWDNHIKDFVGTYPPNDLLGSLQDIHWSHGSFGYFPIYSLGKLYAAMIWKKMNEDIPDINDKISNGQFAVLRNWLRDKIHMYGRLVTPDELITDVCGEQLNEKAYIDYIDAKVNDLYFS